MKVDIFIHGVPNGQRIWSTGNGDDPIIKQFYGAEGEEQTLFLAEVRKSGGQNFCYYSILKKKNVIAENGRSGAYFGLTIRMDMVCKKIKTMFNILQSTYDRAINGKFLKDEGARLHFLVNDFKDKEDLCKATADIIMNVLGNTVEAGDFVAMSPSMLNGKATPKVNLSEFYSSANEFTTLNQNGSIAVSPDYPSTQMAAYMKNKEAEVTALQQQIQKEIANVRQQAEQDLKAEKQRSNTALQQTREEANSKIEQIKAKYADVDKKTAELEQFIKQAQRESQNLQKNITALQREIQERDKIIDRLNRSRNGGGAGTYTDPISKPSVTDLITTKILPFVNLLIMIALLVLVIFLMPSDKSKTVDQISNDLTELKEKMLNDTLSTDTIKRNTDSLLTPIQEETVSH